MTGRKIQTTFLGSKTFFLLLVFEGLPGLQGPPGMRLFTQKNPGLFFFFALDFVKVNSSDPFTGVAGNPGQPGGQGNASLAHSYFKRTIVHLGSKYFRKQTYECHDDMFS